LKKSYIDIHRHIKVNNNQADTQIFLYTKIDKNKITYLKEYSNLTIILCHQKMFSHFQRTSAFTVIAKLCAQKSSSNI